MSGVAWHTNWLHSWTKSILTFHLKFWKFNRLPWHNYTKSQSKTNTWWISLLTEFLHLILGLPARAVGIKSKPYQSKINWKLSGSLGVSKTRQSVSGTHWFLFTLGWWRWQWCRHYDGWRGRVHCLAGVIWRPGSCCWKRDGRKEKSEWRLCVSCFHMRYKQPQSESLSGNGVISLLVNQTHTETTWS